MKLFFMLPASLECFFSSACFENQGVAVHRAYRVIPALANDILLHITSQISIKAFKRNTRHRST